MALIHAAQLQPSKAEAVATWLAAQPWAPDDVGDLELVGAYRFDDPEGEVGLETQLARVGGRTFQVPVTYRARELPGAQEHLVAVMEHSVLGTRYAYDGCADPAFTRMLATATLTGVGQAAEVQHHDGRDRTRPPSVHLAGGGWRGEWCHVDGFAAPVTEDGWTRMVSDTLDLRLSREPHLTEVELGWTLEATWAGQETPLVLALAVETGEA